MLRQKARERRDGRDAIASPASVEAVRIEVDGSHTCAVRPQHVHVEQVTDKEALRGLQTQRGQRMLKQAHVRLGVADNA
jgi:hypothetical protein